MNSAGQSFHDAPVDGSETAARLRHLETATRRGERLAAAVWFPLLLWGLVEAASVSAISEIERAMPAADQAAIVAGYWTVMSVAVVGACIWFYGRRPVQVRRPVGVTTLVITFAMVGVAVGAGAVADIGGVAELGVALGLGLIAALYHSRLVGLVALAHLAAGVVIALTGSDAVSQAAVIGAGAASCVCALIALSIYDRTMWERG